MSEYVVGPSGAIAKYKHAEWVDVRAAGAANIDGMRLMERDEPAAGEFSMRECKDGSILHGKALLVTQRW